MQSEAFKKTMAAMAASMRDIAAGFAAVGAATQKSTSATLALAVAMRIRPRRVARLCARRALGPRGRARAIKWMRGAA